MQCREFREMADSYLGDELLVETNHDVLKHLEDCAACRLELSARRDVRDKLRRAFASAPELQVRPEFAAQLHAQLLKANDARGRKIFFARPAWLALAACLLVVGAFGLRALRPQQPSTPTLASNGSRTTQESATRIAVSELSELAAGDHQNCAVKYRLAETPIELNEAGRKYDPVFLNLDQSVALKSGTAAADAVELVESHACVFQGQRFGHVIVKYQGHLVSLLITDKGESGANDGVARVETASDATPDVSACAPSGGYQVSCFETARHAVFVVSDLSESENLRLARVLAPPVRAHVARAERAVQVS